MQTGSAQQSEQKTRSAAGKIKQHSRQYSPEKFIISQGNQAKGQSISRKRTKKGGLGENKTIFHINR
jgi:hypothetical protein